MENNTTQPISYQPVFTDSGNLALNQHQVYYFVGDGFLTAAHFQLYQIFFAEK
jgi:hypothetical protein